MHSVNENRLGYKHTPLGWIPEEWEVKEVGEFAKLSSGTTPARKYYERFYSNGNIPWVKTTDLNNSEITATEESVTEAALQETSLKIFPKDSILVAMYGGFNQIGRTGLLKMPATVNQALTVIQLQKNIVPKYILEWFNYRVRYWKNFAGSSRKDPNITGKDVADFPVVLPAYDEQLRISTILSIWDEAISQTKQLIDQLQQRNRGLIQDLLGGKRRLKGFTEKWKEVRLEDVFTERNETGYITLDLLSVGSLGIYPQSQSDKRDISNGDKTKYKRICPGDIGYNTMRMWQGRSALSSLEGIVSPAYTIVTPKKGAFPMFFAFLFKLPSVVHRFFRNSQGLVEDTLNCKFKDFSLVRVEIPEYDEQVTIATILTKTVEEIKVYEQKLAIFQKQKKGLMQKLLTGEIRVKI
jgi:type I restriction enzyme S subunit